MHTIYIGYSTVLSGCELIKYFDIDPDHEKGISKFEQEFGCNYVEPGSFEVYDRKEYDGFIFDAGFFARLVPFAPDPKLISAIDFDSVRSIFYIETPTVTRTENGIVKLLGPMTVDKFDFE